MNTPPSSPLPAPLKDSDHDPDQDPEDPNEDLRARAKAALANVRAKTNGHVKKTRMCQEVYSEELVRDSKFFRFTRRHCKIEIEDQRG